MAMTGKSSAVSIVVLTLRGDSLIIRNNHRIAQVEERWGKSCNEDGTVPNMYPAIQ